MANKTELIITGGVPAGGDDYIDSQELLVMVNDARKECGQAAIINKGISNMPAVYFETMRFPGHKYVFSCHQGEHYPDPMAVNFRINKVYLRLNYFPDFRFRSLILKSASSALNFSAEAIPGKYISISPRLHKSSRAISSV